MSKLVFKVQTYFEKISKPRSFPLPHHTYSLHFLDYIMILLEFGDDLLQRSFQSYRETGTGPVLDLACRPCHYYQRQWRAELETELTLP